MPRGGPEPLKPGTVAVDRTSIDCVTEKVGVCQMRPRLIRQRRTTAERSGGVRDERGAGLVELALALPVFVSIMLGTITSGLAINENIQLSHAAREGARYGATIPLNEVFSSGTWASNVRSVVVERFGDDLAAGDVCVAVVSGSPGTPVSASHTTNGDGTACYDDSASGVTDVRVQVVAEVGSFIDTVLVRYDLDLRSEATAKHESNG